MLRAYLGIISHRGLESLWPEFEDTHRFLARRLAREIVRGKLGVWAVMENAAAERIKWQLEAGRYSDAFRVLQGLAAHLGTILPETPALEEDIASI